jgi:hypothetical protein
MEKEKCFCIENKEIYLEQVLVEYNCVPIFFICSSGNEYYVALCTDIDEFNYIVVKTPAQEIYNLLNEKTTMRDIILNQREYWEVISADDMSDDKVKKSAMNKIDYSVLPEENAYYKILTDDVKIYKQKFENDYLNLCNFNKLNIEDSKEYNMAIKDEFARVNAYKEYIEYSIKLKNLINKEYKYEQPNEDNNLIFKMKKTNLQISKMVVEKWKTDNELYAA